MVKVRFGFHTSAEMSFMPNFNEIMTVMQITHADKILNMMKRLKDYSLGISFSIERFGGNIIELTEKSIVDVLQSKDCSSIVSEIAAFSQQTVETKIDLESIRDEGQLKAIASILGSADDYLKQFYVEDEKKKNVIQEHQLGKIITIIRLYYAMLLAGRLHELKRKMDKNEDDSSIWGDVYEIGLLQGELNLLASLSDQEIIRIHHSSRAAKRRTEGHESKSEVKAQEELLQNQRLAKYLTEAEEEWNKKKEMIYHSAMADRLITKHPDLKGDRDILVEKLRPIAKKYRFSDFCEGELKKNAILKGLCQSLNNDLYGLRFTSPDNTIERLNEIIMTPDFYSKWLKKKKAVNLSAEAANLVSQTQDYRNKKFSDMTEDEQTKIKRLNRLLLEQTYPMTPKSLKHGLMRGWEGKTKKV